MTLASRCFELRVDCPVAIWLHASGRARFAFPSIIYSRLWKKPCHEQTRRFPLRLFSGTSGCIDRLPRAFGRGSSFEAQGDPVRLAVRSYRDDRTSWLL